MIRKTVNQFLFQAVDIAPLVFFRIAFGLLMLVESIGAIFIGFVHEAYIEPQFHFSYFLFEWLQPLPGNGMVYLYLFMTALGFMIMTGWWYKTACTLFFLCFTYGFLIEKAHYINHHYLAILYAFLLIFMPANRYYSIDARNDPSIKTKTIPYWPVFLLLSQLAVVYIFASIAKMNPDWMAAKPLMHWFSFKTDWPVIGYFFQFEFTAWLFAWGGIIFDGLIVFLMIWKRTRLVTFILSIIFHMTNLVTFHIGIFPFMAIALTALFFPSHNFRRWMFPGSSAPDLNIKPLMPDKPGVIVAFCAIWLLIQIAAPTRTYIYNEDPQWTEKGHRFAWRMMLRAKSGHITYLVELENETKTVRTRDFLTNAQARKVPVSPDMIWQKARFLRDHYEEQGKEVKSIKAEAHVSLNGRDLQPFTDPDYNLLEYSWKKCTVPDWVKRRE